MADDFRVQPDFFSHPKTAKLTRIGGDLAPYNLIRLWGWTTTHRPDGDLTGLSDEDLEIILGVTPTFLSAIREVGFLDGCELHDWAEHQPWVVGKPERIKAAKKAAKSRWNADRMRGACEPYAKGNAPSPLPSPSPPPKNKSNGESGLSPSDGFEEWWAELRPWFKAMNRRLAYKQDALKEWRKMRCSTKAAAIIDRTVKQRSHWMDSNRSGQRPIQPQDPHRYLKNRRFNDEI